MYHHLYVPLEDIVIIIICIQYNNAMQSALYTVKLRYRSIIDHNRAWNNLRQIKSYTIIIYSDIQNPMHMHAPYTQSQCMTCASCNACNCWYAKTTYAHIPWAYTSLALKYVNCSTHAWYIIMWTVMLICGRQVHGACLVFAYRSTHTHTYLLGSTIPIHTT